MLFLLRCLFTILQPFQARLRPALRTFTMIAVAGSLVLSPITPAFAFGTPDSAAHAALADQEAADHGHSHDEDEPHSPPGSHTHSHDPADHSHQYAFLSGGTGQWGLPPALGWPSAQSGRPDAALGLGIERPPKRTASL